MDYNQTTTEYNKESTKFDLNIDDILATSDLKLISRLSERKMWSQTLLESTYTPFLYTNQCLDYQKTYQEGHGAVIKDFSSIIVWDNKPAAVWPLSLMIKNDNISLGSFGMPLLAPLFLPNCKKRSIKTIVNACIVFMNDLSKRWAILSIESVDFFTDKLSASQWLQSLMANGSTCQTSWDMFLDLKPPQDVIRTNFRKSYKPLISIGQKCWKTNVLDIKNELIWKEFKDLHLEVSGRKTRSEETWDCQLNAIESGNAFLIYLRDSSDRMMGGGFFEYNKDEASYSVGAYDRNLFDKPIGHVVQNQAIIEMKKRNISWYKIGNRSFVGDSILPTDKEVSISEFKQGFCSDLFPKYLLKLETKNLNKSGVG